MDVSRRTDIFWWLLCAVGGFVAGWPDFIFALTLSRFPTALGVSVEAAFIALLIPLPAAAAAIMVRSNAMTRFGRRFSAVLFMAATAAGVWSAMIYAAHAGL